MSGIVEQALMFAKKCHEGDNSGHDFEHILRVMANAEKILAEEPLADAQAVRVAVALHDVDDYKLGSDGARVKSFLSEIGVQEDFAKKVLDIVSSIGFSKSGSHPNFQMIEQAIVSDADKLDAVGAIGVCRMVMYSAATKRPLFNEQIFPDENLTPEQYQNKNRATNHAINHFFDKLLKLKGAMQTKVGKMEAEKRHLFMIAFLREFFDEVRADEWQEYLDKFLKQTA